MNEHIARAELERARRLRDDAFNKLQKAKTELAQCNQFLFEQQARYEAQKAK